ncbi:hemolysin III [Pilibacter termitis]|uniref:Hemolysin III n=1 Tax=Pilibacter termitis TaxID=263852 RepID=A0A1T4NZ29_9ENTE|nr:hemolysin III family protein [Pilibacter termitis]SJZ84471.1 hemolysin III [Pilibacter termitis]
MENPKFTRGYLILNEVLNAVTHGIACALSIAGLVILLLKGSHTGSPVYIAAYALYGATLILLFLSSTLFHSLIFTKAKKVFQVFDHSSIFLLIAGSYTPYCLLSIKGWMGITMLVAIWVIAILGVVYKSIFLHRQEKVSKISTILYVAMGWICVFAIQPLYNALGINGLILLVLGGVSYTVGAFFYSLKNVRFMHVVWHLFVMAGACFMFFSILFNT